MPWRSLERIAFAIAIYPFEPSSPADLPLELGDELYIIEEGGKDWSWCRGYLVAPPSILAGLTSVKGQTLEARVFSGIFPKACVEIREMMEHTGARMEETARMNGDSKYLRDGSVKAESDTDGQHDDSAEDADEELTDESSVEDQNLDTAAPNIFKSSAKTKVKKEDSHPPSSSPAEVATPEARSKPPPPVPLLKIGDETPSLISEPLVDEIASCLREWQSTKLHELLLSRKYLHLERLGRIVQRVDLCRRQLLHDVLTAQELEAMREATVWDLVNGNKLVGDEIIVRDPKQRGRLLTGTDDPIEVAKLQSSMSLLDKPPLQPPDRVNLHHVLFELKEVTFFTKEKSTIVAYICSKKPDEPPKMLSEPFSLELPAQVQESLPKTSSAKLRTLFADLSSLDIGEASNSDVRVYLVIKIQFQVAAQPISANSSRAGSIRESQDRPDTAVGERTSSLKGRRSLMWDKSKSPGSQRFRPQTPAISEHPPAENGQTNETPKSKSDSSQTSSSVQKGQLVDRDAGIAVLGLTRKFFEDSNEIEESVPVWTTSQMQESQGSPNHLDFLKEHFPSSSGHYASSKSINQFKFRLHSFLDPDANTLIRTRPTLLQHVVKTPKMGFSGAPTKPRSDIYLTIVKPNFPGQALFAHPEKGAVPIAAVKDMRDLQLTLEVRKSSGQRIERCIYPSSNSTAQTAWRTTAILHGESWSQTIRLAVPSEDVPNCHMIMSLANFPDFPFALCWMPLWKDGAFVQDGKHMLLLHEYNKMTTSTLPNGRNTYLDLAWDSKAKDSSSRESWSSHMSCLQVDSFLCSTTFSQDQVLIGLLKWKEHANDELLLLLRQVVFVPEIEIVKLVSDTLDALFSILVDRSGSDEFEDLVFNALVTVLSIVHDRRFHLDPLVNEYADLRFNYPFATPCLVRSYLRLIARRADYQNSRQLRATLKVGRQMIKFILVARKQQQSKEAGIGITATDAVFVRDFKKIFTALEDQMRDESPSLIGSKTLIVQHIHTWLPELLPCFSHEEIFDIGISFVDACSRVTGKLILHKLVLIWNFSKLSVSAPEELQVKLEAKIEQWIAPYWGTVSEPDEQYREQVRLCCSIVAQRGGDYGDEAPKYYRKIIQSYHCIRSMERQKAGHFSLLFPSTYPFPTRPTNSPRNYNEALIELVSLKANFTGDILIKHFGKIPDEVIRLVRMAMDINFSVMREEPFPRSWLTLHVYHYRFIFNILDSTARFMIQHKLPPMEEAEKFDTELWKILLLAILELVRSEALALEILPEQKRRAVWKIVGDIRQSGAELLGNIWETIGWETDAEEKKQYGLTRLGGYQVQYVPSLVGPIVELCLSVHEGLRGCAVEILQSMIISEWSLNEDLGVIQAAMIYALDDLFKTKNIGESAQNRFFIGQLLEVFESFSKDADSQLWQATKELLEAIDELLDLLIAVHSPGQHEALRIMNTLRLMDFLRGLQKEDIFIGYVHQLAAVEAQAHNCREAGLALGLHADLYEWDPSQMVEALKNPILPKQTAFERKEKLFFEMIKHFEEGHAWGSALDCYRELAEQYEHVTFDFAKLARTQRATARMYEFIARGDGETSRYFRVVFRGLGFPIQLRGKEFIYEGYGSERLTNFTDHLQQQHPEAQITSRTDVENAEGQYLYVTAVTAYRELDHPAFQRSRVPLPTKEFLIFSKPDKFSVTSKRHSPKIGVSEQWVEKTIYSTAETFPTILRRSEIVSEEKLFLSPLETAVERTVRKTFELSILQKRVLDGDKASLATMLDAIKSSVDPTSSVSVAQYRSHLIKKQQQQLSTSNSDDTDAPSSSSAAEEVLYTALQTGLLDFATILKHCLVDLSRMPAHSLEHKNFSILFQSTFAPELSQLSHTTSSSTATATVGTQRISSSAPDPELVLPPSNLDDLPLANGFSAFPAPPLQQPQQQHEGEAADGPTVPQSSHSRRSFLDAGRGRLNSLLRRSVTEFDGQYQNYNHNHSLAGGAEGQVLNGDSAATSSSQHNHHDSQHHAHFSTDTAAGASANATKPLPYAPAAAGRGPSYSVETRRPGTGLEGAMVYEEERRRRADSKGATGTQQDYNKYKATATASGTANVNTDINSNGIGTYVNSSGLRNPGAGAGASAGTSNPRARLSWANSDSAVPRRSDSRSTHHGGGIQGGSGGGAQSRSQALGNNYAHNASSSRKGSESGSGMNASVSASGRPSTATSARSAALGGGSRGGGGMKKRLSTLQQGIARQGSKMFGSGGGGANGERAGGRVAGGTEGKKEEREVGNGNGYGYGVLREE